MNSLREFLTNIQPGAVPDPSGLDGLLADHWNDFEGSTEGGMEAYKLVSRMESVRWQPPILSFVVERHGGTVKGSTRGELQHWEVDLDSRTAQIVRMGHRQLKPMAPRVSHKAIAEEIAERMQSGEDDQRIKRLEHGSVKVLVSKIFPTGSGFQETISGRRRRFRQSLEEQLAQKGWVKAGSDVFKPPGK